MTFQFQVVYKAVFAAQVRYQQREEHVDDVRFVDVAQRVEDRREGREDHRNERLDRVQRDHQNNAAYVNLVTRLRVMPQVLADCIG